MALTCYLHFKRLFDFLYHIFFLSHLLEGRKEWVIKTLARSWGTSELPYEYFLYNTGVITSFLWLFFRSFAMKSTYVMTTVFSKVKGVRSDLNHLLSKNAWQPMRSIDSLLTVSHTLICMTISIFLTEGRTVGSYKNYLMSK